MMKAGNIKVMIADDESIVRKGLRSTVPWDRFGMEVVADSPNGQAAWEAFLEFRPQVVITDIVMPEMDGIELSRKVKEAAPETRIILLSCHRDFEYAQEGMRLGASGYLLKTAFEDEELEAMLGKFQRELSDAPANGYGLEEQVSAHLFAWLNGHSDHFPGELRKLCSRVGLGEGKPISLYLIKTAGCGGSWERLLGEQGSEEPGLRSSKRVPYGADSCYWAVAEEYKEAADGLLVEIKSRCGKLAWNWRGGLQDSEDVQKAFQSLHKEAELERVYGLSGEQWPEPILQAVHLLHEHPADEWSAAELAQQVGLSRSHFSILFKKTVGDSFIAFQYKRKLRLAYGLLRETSLTMQEIAEKTGLGDSKYFSKWFKRCTGQTPSQYRAEQKGESS
ncbi:response regulator [Cytobacillus firmus]|jgi:two-component system response regulator YesN|uniref:response regulator transcription factor n=1 Tax=Paenibacillus lautus TaxID=1401 RepID=UPI0026E9C918|nr:response regulator [Paenibacillus lautus]MBY0162707.1 response regulator [Cytobacillus firmus]MCI1777465.1 response regulator [Paenibacillus lautus]